MALSTKTLVVRPEDVEGVALVELLPSHQLLVDLVRYLLPLTTCFFHLSLPV